MRTIRKPKLTLLLMQASLLIILLSVSGCSKEELSREKAKELISTELKPEVISYTYGASTRLENYDFDDATPALEQAGLIEVDFVRDIDNFMDIGITKKKSKFKISTTKLYETKLTAKGREYLLKEEEIKSEAPEEGIKTKKGTFKLADLRLKEIVDIQNAPEKGGAIVKFVISRDKTPFWVLRTTNSAKLIKGTPPGDEVEHTILIRKTDEGWKL